ncbi:MAG: hypothetical protein ACI97A_000846 [Planctomycetota bacterium]
MKVSKKVRFATAMVVWLAVAVMLIYRGLVPHFGNIDSNMAKIVALSLAAVLGIAKGIFVISKSTARTAAFIIKRPSQDWIWMSFHPVLYVLIPVMILFGYWMKDMYAVSKPEVVVGVYVGIGIALLVGIRGFRKII